MYMSLLDCFITPDARAGQQLKFSDAYFTKVWCTGEGRGRGRKGGGGERWAIKAASSTCATWHKCILGVFGV